ncbi:hypothetical protein [Dactylosporangium darangshiense]|uniref:DUF3396 domain-containing protein n=1 Tax=Dactylosporangium darangshiense TaxID=579108 RepID=A0ABP8DTC8_9ACTN
MRDVDEPVGVRPGRDWWLPILQVQLYVAVSEDRGRAVTAAQRWFRDGFTQLGGAFYDPAAQASPTELHIETRLSRREPHAVSIMLSIPQRGGDGYLHTAYSPVMFDALVESLQDLPRGANLWFDANGDDGESHTGPTLGFDLDRIDSDTGAWLQLRLLTLRTPLTQTNGMAPLLAFVRGVANLGNPVHGEIFWGNQTGGVFEWGIGKYVEQSLPQARQLLRGYAWLTILPEEIGQRLGGLDALRFSGAFVEVEHLDAGGYWCRATPSIEQYDQAAAERVFEVVAPALPPGPPDLRRVSRPNALSARDASNR